MVSADLFQEPRWQLTPPRFFSIIPSDMFVSVFFPLLSRIQRKLQLKYRNHAATHWLSIKKNFKKNLQQQEILNSSLVIMSGHSPGFRHFPSSLQGWSLNNVSTPVAAAVLLIMEHSMSGALYRPCLHYYPLAALQARRSSPVCMGPRRSSPVSNRAMTLQNGRGPVPLIRRSFGGGGILNGCLWC